MDGTGFERRQPHHALRRPGVAGRPNGQRRWRRHDRDLRRPGADSLHRLTSSTNGAGAAVGYGYDLKGLLTSITYPGGTNQVTRGYDDAGRLTSVTDWLSHTTGFQYDADSNLTTENYPNSTHAARTYNDADQLTSIADSKNSTAFLSLTYTRDARNQLTTENSPTYGYDDNNRLAGGGDRTYSHDDADRLTQVAMSGGNTSTLSYDAADQVGSLTVTNGTTQVSSLTYGCDNNGNRTSQTDQSGVTTTLGYDQANRLVSYGGAASYTYDGDGLRMSKTVSGGTTAQTWDVAEGLPLLIADGALSYVTGPGGLPLEQVNADGTVWYFHADQLGSTRALTDQSGSVVATYSYDAYGNQTSQTGVSTALRYAAQYTDVESGLYYLRSRYYDPMVGQFTSSDPLTPVTRQPYMYGADSPLDRTDPSGDFALAIPFGGALAGIGLGFEGLATVALAGILPALAVVAALWPVDAGGGDEGPYSLDGHTMSQISYSPHARDEMDAEGIGEGDVEAAMERGAGRPSYRERTVYYDPQTDVTVVVAPDGTVVTSHRGKPKDWEATASEDSAGGGSCGILE